MQFYQASQKVSYLLKPMDIKAVYSIKITNILTYFSTIIIFKIISNNYVWFIFQLQIATLFYL